MPLLRRPAAARDSSSHRCSKHHISSFVLASAICRRAALRGTQSDAPMQGLGPLNLSVPSSRHGICI